MGFSADRPPIHSTAARPLRVLVAEDEAVNRMAALALLRRAGHSVVTVEDGPSAVAAATDPTGDGFDLLLLDLGLPGFDGDEAARRIRRQPRLTGTAPRILMLTATATPDGLARCRACGADGLLTKPLRLDALETALTNSPTNAAPDDGAAFDPNAIAQMRDLLPADRVGALIAKTADTLRQYRTALADAWNGGDPRAAGAMAHKVAGVSGQYGCVALRRAAQALEAALERDGLAGANATAALTRFDEAYDPALAYLDRQTLG
ncbi:response regulator [Azospirillum sp.]|uniref:response regulator n=1 Tax=Azospirillum sp. TaxID=34012 RepID=UPI00262C15F3|nr:response regulator [Azospirillum sp.]